MEPGDVSSPERRGHESTECILVLEREVIAESLEQAVFLRAVTPPVP